MAKCDVIGSEIHVSILEKSGFLINDEKEKLMKALAKVYDQISDDKFVFDKTCEDIHTAIQNALEKEIGNLVLKLHTARSRNDQVLFDMKIFCKYTLLKIKSLCSTLQEVFKKSISHKNTANIIIPGYTHLQHAQLIKLSDYLESYVEMLNRDCERLGNIEKNIVLNLGAGAFAGTPIEASIYNEGVAKYINEDKKHAEVSNITANVSIAKTVDTVSDRDFVIEILSALSILGMHLSRLAEDLIIWSTKEFGFVEMDDAFATGSSLMPQKKNPDVLELIRGYTGILYGNLMSVLTTMKGLPLTYNRDMQLDKPPLFSSFEIIEKELKVLAPLMESLVWKKEKIAETIKDDESLYATDFVYFLIKEKGIPFKTAHDIIGQVISASIEVNGLSNLSDNALKKIHKDLDKKELTDLMVPEKSVNSRISVKKFEK